MATLNDLSKAIGEIQQYTKTRRFLQQIGKVLVDRIRVRTRLGKGVKEENGNNFRNPHSLPRLKQQTVSRRQRLRRAGGLTGFGATPAKSGLNRSGKLLDRLHFKIEGRELIITLDPRGKIIAEKLMEDNPDWEFMNLSKPEFNYLVDTISKDVERIIRRYL